MIDPTTTTVRETGNFTRVDPKETPEKQDAADTPETANVAENTQAANTSNPQVEPPDEHSPDPIMTHE